MINLIDALSAEEAAGNKNLSVYANLQQELLDRWKIEVPVIPWPAPPRRLIRISAQLYNSTEQYDSLATALGELFRGTT